MQEAISIEREVSLLHENFLYARFWERTILLQENPEADRNFGELLEQITKSLKKLYANNAALFIQKEIELILANLAHYENDFNRIIQLKNEQRLHSTRMETSYESLASYVLRSNEDDILKYLFNMSRFHNSYRINRRESEYQALLLVASSLENKLIDITPQSDSRAIGYLKKFIKLLNEDFALENEAEAINANFYSTSNKLSKLHSEIFKKSKLLLQDEFVLVKKNRQRLNFFVLTFFLISFVILSVVLILIFNKIIIPIRSVAGVMREVNKGNIGVRYSESGNRNDEIVDFCLSFNDMLDTLQSHNQKLLNYQNELEKKVIYIGQRSIELTTINKELNKEIYERKKLEDEKEKIQEQLLQLNESLQDMVNEQTLKIKEREKQLLHVEKLSAVGRLSASIAHEFNNPLQGVLNVFRGVETRATLTDNDRELVELAIKECDRMKDLVHKLQQFNKPSSGIKNETDIHHVIDEVLLFARKELKSKKITLSKEYGRDLPRIWIVGDQIKQVLLNLLSNAIDAIPGDEGEVTITTTSLNRKGVTITIKDTGKGIMPENIQHIFEPFYSTKADAGTGLGLYTSYSIIKSHGGDINVESEVGRGATFTITIPTGIRK